MIPLSIKQYGRAEEILSRTPINTLFAKSILHGQVQGEVYADDADEPGAIYIVHPYGMSLLAGENGRPDFAEELTDYITNRRGDRTKTEWLQVYPHSWFALLGNEAVKESGKVIEFARINFGFDRERHQLTAAGMTGSKPEIMQTAPELFARLEGVAPKQFWRSAEHFGEHGIGFTVMDGGEAASTAFAAFIEDGQLEIGIESMEGHRGKGYAYHASAALIAYCLEHDLEPVWACRKGNEGSFNLAQKLGFVPTLDLPYYRLDV
ncbi:GNAT family N-acetyltransferase [Paenibacillus sp. HN-1]|uniref:GNAT family N-acetyltransferase n=1 Tax=Paenibacillus TaxID=44249 RepID=UPI001CA98709|nr:MULTISPECIES: GNAT family N-acetyltransferase [Paenibacillus]MBY9080266.1 GNAT family N-acetyltransferase [Paenibacillus sp. CGMCC 1.18879]MBY9083075.1 GNAT family N-acetyltransferase [Paenibacillus sinensis]